MGLKTTNLYIKKLDLVLPEAYALITDIISVGVYAHATIGVQSSRENAKKMLTKELDPYYTVTIDFPIDRKVSDRVMAYRIAKEPIPMVRVTEEGDDIYLEEGPFSGWEDDVDAE